MNFEKEGLSSTISQAASQQGRLCSQVPALFFRGILPAKVWKLLSHIHMVNRFRDSFHRKTFLFLTANNAGWRGSNSHTSMTEHVTHKVTHTHIRFHPFSFAPLSLLLCVSPSVLPFHNLLVREVRKCKERARKKKKSEASTQNLPFSLSRSCSSPTTNILPPSLPQSSCFLAPVSGMSLPCLRGVSAPLAKPIDPLITCGSTTFSEEQVCACTFHTHFK